MPKEILDHLEKSWKALKFDYSPITTREPLRFPKNARVAFWVVPNIEHFVLDRSNVSLFPNNLKPDVSGYSWRDYSPRVGVWRVMKVMDKYGVKGTVALNSAVCKYYPEIIQACKERGWEFMGHGIANSWFLGDIDEKTERAMIKEVVTTIQRSTGKKPQGWLGPAMAETYRSLDILAENGIRYVCDWTNDDQPYQMKVKKGSLFSIPYSAELNDLPIFIRNGFTAEEFYQMCKEQFDTLYDEGAENGRVMCLSLHPFVIGQPFRIKALDRVLKYITGKKDVWVTTGSEIIDWTSKSHKDKR
ncbi:MAG: polysaccharide deacetylase family protein [Nitrososphaerales archaeon]|nr:polysaccharide deacetylase family protein [Nitrososphaerota archaeon]